MWDLDGRRRGRCWRRLRSKAERAGVGRRRRSTDRGGLSMGALRGLPVLLSLLGVVDRRGEAGGFGFAPVALVRPMGLVLLLVRVVIGLPRLVGGLVLSPTLAFGLDRLAAGDPVGLGDRLVLLVAGGVVVSCETAGRASRTMRPAAEIEMEETQSPLAAI